MNQCSTGRIMFHANTQRLIEEWGRQRGAAGGLPARTSISPVAFGPLLPQLFILGVEPDGVEAFRLAGGLLADLHGRDLRGADFFRLWRSEDRDRLSAALMTARQTGAILVVTANAATVTGQGIDLEIALAPLTGATGEADRIIGLYQPISLTRQLIGKPVSQLAVRKLDIVGDAHDTPRRHRLHLKLVVDNTRRVA